MTDAFEIPVTLFDYIVQVQLKKPLTQDEMTQYIYKYQQWIKEECPKDWFVKDRGHFMKVYQCTNGSDQCLVYLGTGIKELTHKVSESFLESREYALKHHECITTMLTRMYVFSRLMGLPIETEQKQTITEEPYLLPKPQYIQATGRQVYGPKTKRVTFVPNKIHRTQENGLVCHSKYEMSFFYAPKRLEKRSESMPVIVVDNEADEYMRSKLKRRGYTFVNYNTHE